VSWPQTKWFRTDPSPAAQFMAAFRSDRSRPLALLALLADVAGGVGYSA
jgi:hypothetical protein